MWKTDIGRLRVAGLLEGTSFLLLLGVAMPLKYLAGMPLAVTIVGGAHGFLFVLYALFALTVSMNHDWPFSRLLLAALAAVLPFGPFVFDRKFLDQDTPQPANNAA